MAVSWNRAPRRYTTAHRSTFRAGRRRSEPDRPLAARSRAGIYKYRPTGNDVTFRLEVVESAGQVSAESFRFVRNAAVVTPPAPPPPATKVVRRTERRRFTGFRLWLPQASGLASRHNRDRRARAYRRAGRVTSAVPAVKAHQGLDSYLSASAVQAARLWRFEPARENGKAVPGTQTIHFVSRSKPARGRSGTLLNGMKLKELRRHSDARLKDAAKETTAPTLKSPECGTGRCRPGTLHSWRIRSTG